MSSEEIIEVGKALLPYLRKNITNVELGHAAHDAVAALNRVRARKTGTEISVTDELLGQSGKGE